MEEFCAASDAVFAAERSLAAHIGQAHAVPLHFPLRWDFGGGAPLPCLLSNDRKTFLVFRVAGAATNVAMVEFKRCVCLKMGTPNDEVYEGHSLHGKGLEPYRPLRVINSPWIKGDCGRDRNSAREHFFADGAAVGAATLSVKLNRVDRLWPAWRRAACDRRTLCKHG